MKDSKADGPSQKDSLETKSDESESGKSKDEILINRAPVLELWAATVASFLYPDVSWETSLSAGSAVSTLCAISKGRAIDTIDEEDPSSAEKKERHSKSDQLDELEVMGFHLKLTDGHALVGGKPKKANEQVLIKKFGEAEYKRVKESFPRCIAVVVRAGRGVECTSIPPLRGVQTDCAQRSEGMGKERHFEPSDCKEAVSPD